MNEAIMIEIPVEIFRIIQLYLNKHDYRQLLNTNSTIFQDVKYETVYYNLRIVWKEKETIEERNRIIDYLTRLYESVKDKSKQISLHIHDIVEECRSFMSGIHKLVYIYDVSRGNHNMSVFSHVYSLRLQGISGIDCLSGLSGVKILRVSYSNSLKAIDFIPDLKRLVLDSLPELVEIAEYKNIPELYIRRCPMLNLTGFGNHERFSLEGWSYRLSDFDLSMFQSVQYLVLPIDHQCIKGLDNIPFPCFSNLKIFSINYNTWNNKYFHLSSFPNLRHLKLTNARIRSEILFPLTLQIAEFKECKFDDLFVLSKIKELRFYRCQGKEFNNVNSLSDAYKLAFSNIPELQNVSSLDRVHELNILSCKNIIDISKLGRIHRLTVAVGDGNKREVPSSLEGLGQGNSAISLSSFSKIVDFSPLRFIYKVTLESCDGLVDGRDLSDVKILTISRCKNFQDTRDLGKVKHLALITCKKIERLIALENVANIHLEDCDWLEDIDCLGKQQSLIIIDCSRLQRLMNEDVSGKYGRLLQGINFLRIDDRSLSWHWSRGSNKMFLENFDLLIEK